MLLTQHLSNNRASIRRDVEYYVPIYYAPIMEKVLKARQYFLAWADTLPPAVRKTILHMSQGVQETLPGRLVGERDAFWLGEIVGASEEAQLTAAVGSIAGYAYFLHQDCIVDGDADKIRASELAQNFLYAKLLESFASVAQDNASFWYYWSKYLSEYTTGSLFEATECQEPRRYTREDLALVASRSAPVKICAVSLALASERTQDIPRLETAIEELTIGLQFRDDISDCVDDFLRGNYTPVVSRLVNEQGSSIESIKKSALYTNSLTEMLDECTLHLHKASKTLDLTAEMSLQAYIGHLIAQNHAVNDRLLRIKEAIAPPDNADNPKDRVSFQEEFFWSQIEEEVVPIRVEY